MDKADKVRENRLRRNAKAWGFLLIKSRARDPLTPGYGLYALVEDTAGNRRPNPLAAVNQFVRGEGLSSLDEVEAELTAIAQQARS